MRVDAHHHLWDLSVRDQPWTAGMPALRRSFSVDDLRPELASAGIDATVVVQTVGVLAETEELLALAAGEPLITGVVGWVDLTSPSIADDLDRLQDGPGGDRLVAIRNGAQDEPDPRWLMRPDVLNGLRQVAARELAYDLLVRPPQFAAAVDVVGELPEVTFVLDHAGKPDIAGGGFDVWQPLLQRLAGRANVSVKLSGLVTEADVDHWTTADIRPYAEQLITSFGPDRVMYGSDWPVCNLAGGYPRVAALAAELISELSLDEQKMIMGGTAERWYRWKDAR
jgi:L-fuconolactonase